MLRVNDKYNVSLDEPDSDEERDEDNEEEDDGPFDTAPLYYKSPEIKNWKILHLQVECAFIFFSSYTRMLI
jgi:hypothetical protein